MDEDRAFDTLRLVEALLEGATTEGERAAAARARERMLAKIARIRAQGSPVEYRFSMPDPWSRRLLVALLRRYQIRPYRYPRQRRTTVMVRAPSQVIDEVVWPEFLRIRTVLQEHLLEITNRIIDEALNSDGAEAAVVQEQLPPGGAD